jgi:hypothetical protein
MLALEMSKSNLVLTIDKPHFTVELYQNMLKIDLKEAAKNEIKEGVETKSMLGQILGKILSMFAPLHVRLSDIDSVKADNVGNVKIVLPHHRDMVIPLDVKDATKLVEKLNDLIPVEKEKELERLMKKHKLYRVEEGKHVAALEKMITPSTPTGSPIPEPPGVRRLVDEAEEETEKHET